MTATLVLPGTGAEADWHEARRKGITASEIAVLMGLSPWSSPYALYHRKTGDLPEQEDTTALSLGRYLEHWVPGPFPERHPEFRAAPDRPALFAHPHPP